MTERPSLPLHRILLLCSKIVPTQPSAPTHYLTSKWTGAVASLLLAKTRSGSTSDIGRSPLCQIPAWALLPMGCKKAFALD
jgi:hypothetical protein